MRNKSASLATLVAVYSVQNLLSRESCDDSQAASLSSPNDQASHIGDQFFSASVEASPTHDDHVLNDGH
ncbi:MAG TPA: hypothetical protein P5307_16450 [Pirellulaceae bacterium]|nr:hypothetical protein [Pirellulaceae bacterium]